MSTCKSKVLIGDDFDTVQSKKIVLRLLVLFLVCVSMAFCNLSWAQVSVRGDQLRSINQFEKGEFGPIKVITKAWRETFDPQRRFDFSFFAYFDEPIDARDYMQEVLVFNDKYAIHVCDFDTADCSGGKMMLIKYEDSPVYLLVAGRIGIYSTGEIIPQCDPAQQKIIIYELFANDSGMVGYPRSYFQKVAETISRNRTCDANDVYKFMLDSINDYRRK